MKRLSGLLAAMLLCSFIACNSKNKEAMLLTKDASIKADSYKSEKQIVENEVINADTAGNNSPSPKQSPPNNKAETKEDWDKKIVKTGNLTIEVKRYKSFNEMLHSDVKQFGGYVAQEEQNQSDYKIENNVTIKVPVDQFENAVSALSAATEKIVEKKITSEDVTGEMFDTKSRMETKKRIRDRYLDLLKQAKNMEEILRVQSEVDGIQENIEAAGGRINYLVHAAAFSTIHINFYQVLNPNLINNPEPSYAFRIKESFYNGLHWFAELFVFLISIWPLWAFVLLGLFFIRKRISSVKNHKTVS